MKFYLKIESFILKICIWKYCLQNGGLSVLTWSIDFFLFFFFFLGSLFSFKITPQNQLPLKNMITCFRILLPKFAYLLSTFSNLWSNMSFICFKYIVCNWLTNSARKIKHTAVFILWRYYSVRTEHIEAKVKLPPFCRPHFQMHFLEWKCINFTWNFTEICSLSSELLTMR